MYNTYSPLPLEREQLLLSYAKHTTAGEVFYLNIFLVLLLSLTAKKVIKETLRARTTLTNQL